MDHDKAHNKKNKVLFICKKRVDTYGISYGLLNSAAFVANALVAKGLSAEVRCVIDGNGIDREVSKYKPTHCMIEALWATADKMRELCSLHPKTIFVVRIHSKVPFLAMEGIAIEWIRAYQAVARKHANLVISGNSEDFVDDLREALGVSRALYLPNIYMPVAVPEPFEFEYESGDRCVDESKKIVNVGCFGAIRPLKNHLAQALAAIQFARKADKQLVFHINGNRVEQRGDTVLKNLRAAFDGTANRLVEHPWTPHAKFIGLVKKMDVGMQVSFSESFNIVAADFVANDVPIVVSKDVSWMPSAFVADPNSVGDIAKKLKRIYGDGCSAAKRALNHHNKKATEEWLDYLDKKK